jgi:hypothetical protein
MWERCRGDGSMVVEVRVKRRPAQLICVAPSLAMASLDLAASKLASGQ